MLTPEQRPGDIDDIPKSGRPGATNVSHPIGKHPDNQRRMWESTTQSLHS